MTTQERVTNYLLNSPSHSLTTLEAFRLIGTTCLATYIHRLRKRGYRITSTPVDVKNRYGNTCRIVRYTLTPASSSSSTELDKPDNVTRKEDN